LKAIHAVIANAAHSETGGSLSLLGIFQEIVTEVVPCVFPSMNVVVFCTAEDELGHKQVNIGIVILNPTGKGIFEIIGEIGVNFPDKLVTGSHVNLHLPLYMTLFQEFGIHTVQVFQNGKLLIETSLNVRKP
jgi:hypothetical protein